MKVAVLMGGTSAEREVSLDTGAEIARALRESGHEVTAIDTGRGVLLNEGPANQIERDAGSNAPGPAEGQAPELPELPGRALALRQAEERLLGIDPDVAFVALHGGAGEDGRLQALLDLVGVPYTGSDYLGSALAMTKQVAKELFEHAGIPTPPWIAGAATAEQVNRELGGFPVVVKPGRQGSTVGVSVVRSEGELEAAVRRAAGYDGEVIVERFIRGRELAVGILGDEALPVVEIQPSHEIYDYDCKYKKGMSEYRVPAPLSDAKSREVQLLALKAHRILRLSDYSRVDFRLDDDERPWCLEANSLPGMTATSLLPKAAAAAGISFNELCERIVQMAVARGSEAGNSGPGDGLEGA